MSSHQQQDISTPLGKKSEVRWGLWKLPSIPFSLDFWTGRLIPARVEDDKVVTALKEGVLVSQGHHNKVLQTGWCQQQKCLDPSFWGLEVQDQGVGRVGSFWGCEAESVAGLSPRFCWFTGNLWRSLVCVCLQISPFYKDTSHTGLGPTLMTSF